ncbi:MAG: hypothetical protein ACLQVM_20815 [Terriglobia bacterium]
MTRTDRTRLQGHLRACLFLCLAMACTATLSASQELERAWYGLYPLSPGGSVAVENIQGEVSVEGWDRAEVEVTAAKIGSGQGDNLDDVRVVTEIGDRSLKFRTVYPPHLEKPVRVNYRLRVPRQVRLSSLRTLEGNIAVHDVEGSVDARTLSGNIEQMNVTGRVVARALTGSILVSLRALPVGTAPLLLDTVNGNVVLLLPPRANADLELTTVAGTVEGNYAFQISSIPGDSTRRTRVGLGGVTVSLRTVRGSIRVAERDELL